MKSINPVSGAVIKEYPTENLNAVTMKITDLQQTFIAWKLTSIEKRIECIKNAATMLRNNEAEYAYVITAEMGKIKKEALREVAKCATLCDYYADHAQEFLAPKFIATEAKKSYVAYCPLGIILGIMPWNFPFWQVFRFAVPTLLAGNVVILKHASNVPGCALLLETIFNAAAEDLNLEPFKTLLINTDMVSDVIANPLVRAVSLTGSVTAGKSVASIAGKHLKKTVLELGGSDPYLVLADADVKAAANACATGRLINCGQSCIAAKRFIVVADVYDEFLKELTQIFSKLKIGDPSQDSTDIGPLANKQIVDTLQKQVLDTIAAGATCHFGGEPASTAGFYFQPTILTNIPENSPGFSQELFGPVACVFKVLDEASAIALANNSDFGLGAAIFSRDIDRATNIAENFIDSGSVFINNFVASDPRLPFGGVKQSGYGRELSEFGIHEFVNIKTISIN